MFQTSMFGKVVRSLCRERHGRTVVAGAVGVLSGVEHLLSSRNRRQKPVPVTPAPVCDIPVSLPPPAPAPAAVAPKPRLKISQTKSELGYVYWVVREFGANPSYALFDSWQEAMVEVTRRIHAATLQSEVEATLIPA